MQQASPQWYASIRKELKDRLEAFENGTGMGVMGPESPALKTVLETWKRDSPKMYARLKRRGMDVTLALVLIARAFDREKELMNAGMMYPDAREQAEREILMLEPETP